MVTFVPPCVITRSSFGIKDHEAFFKGRDMIFESLQDAAGIYAGDNMVLWGRTMGFLDDRAFLTAYNKHATLPSERGAAWRYAVLIWAARRALRIDGDFVECACYRGTTARIVTDVLGLAGAARRYFLYDLFEHDAAMPHHELQDHGAHLYEQVQQRFADAPNVVVTKGRAPDSFAQAAPEKVAFMHIDLNNAEAEVGVLDALFDRLSPGGVVVLDDFGWLGYQAQQVAERKWFGERGYDVLELPTGQGLVIK